MEKAMTLGVTGLVRNEPDGTVKILATGESAALRELADWCRQGPRKARVERIEEHQIPDRHFEGFRIEK